MTANPPKLAKLVEQINEDMAARLAEELRDFLYANHRVTGFLASRVFYDTPTYSTAIVGSDVPYAGYFERRTHAVSRFVAEWRKRAAREVARIGRRAAGRHL